MLELGKAKGAAEATRAAAAERENLATVVEALESQRQDLQRELVAAHESRSVAAAAAASAERRAAATEESVEAAAAEKEAVAEKAVEALHAERQAAAAREDEAAAAEAGRQEHAALAAELAVLKVGCPFVRHLIVSPCFQFPHPLLADAPVGQLPSARCREPCGVRTSWASAPIRSLWSRF